MSTIVPNIANSDPSSEPAVDDLEVWFSICNADTVSLDRGIAALVDGYPIAIFRLAPVDAGSSESWHAVDHLDPRTGTPTIARGLVGSVGDRPVVAAPLHKERYDLVTGACLDDPELALRVHDVRVTDGVVEVLNVTTPKRGRNVAAKHSVT